MVAPGSKFQRHFFVCQTVRPPAAKPSCGARGSAAVYNGLMEALGVKGVISAPVPPERTATCREIDG